MKRFIFIFIIIITLSGCKVNTSLKPITSTYQTSNQTDNYEVGTSDYDDEDDQDEFTVMDETILFSLDGISSLNGQVEITNQTVIINNPGTYLLQGESKDAKIFINIDKEKKVILVLDNVKLTSSDGPVIYADSSEKLIINLKENTLNYMTDSITSTSEKKSVIYSKDDVTINGPGSLIIEANVSNGISSNDELIITNGILSINAKNNALKANDGIFIKDASLTLTAGNDAIHCENTEDTSKGNITIESGNFNINTYGDGFDSSSNVTIFSGNYTIFSGVNNNSLKRVSGKGIKAKNEINILNGLFEIVSRDDSIHSKNITISNGIFTITSDDDGLHADHILTIYDGKIYIIRCYEVIEGLIINIYGGEISYLSTTGDGISRK